MEMAGRQLFTSVLRHLVGESVGTAAVTLLRDGELSRMLVSEVM